MTFEIIVQIILFGIALAMDAFAVSVTDGLIYRNIDKKKIFFIAFIFSFMQALMPLIGYFVIELIRFFIGDSGSIEAINIFTTVVSWVAFTLLAFIGTKMIIEGINEYKKTPEEKEEKLFSVKEVLIMGIATSIDALTVGVGLNSGISTNYTVWLHVIIIGAITFAICLVGLFLARSISRLFKGKYEMATIIGGIILIILAIWIILSHYLGI